MTCPRCGALAASGALFCPVCHAPLAGQKDGDQDMSWRDLAPDIQDDAPTPAATAPVAACGPERRRRLLPIVVLVVVSAILLLAGGVWWGLQSARGVFDSYMAAIASGDVLQADRLSLDSQKAGLTVAPGRRISRVAVSMRGRDAALVSWSLDGRRQEAIIRARRLGAASWKISQGLARKTRISGITDDVTVEGRRLRLGASGKRIIYVPAAGVVKGVRAQVGQAAVSLYPGAYRVASPASSWHAAVSATVRFGQSVSLVKVLPDWRLISRLNQALTAAVAGCLASSSVQASGCGFANPDVQGLDPSPSSLRRSMSGQARFYALDLDSHRFTTGLLPVTCTYTFHQGDADVTRSIQVTGFAKGGWRESDGRILITFQ